MSAVDTMMIAGLCTMPVGFLLAWRLKAKGAGDGLTLGLPVDVCMFFVWGGMLLIQAANIVLHKQAGALYNISALTWGGSAAVLFVFGCVSGRLLLRLEMHRLRQNREAAISS
jgi:hypothetical protein